MEIVSPALSISVSPPGSSPMYCSPSRPEVRIFAEVSFGNWYCLSRSIVTTAWYALLSKPIEATRPTVTPALFTGARAFRPPILSNLSLTG